MNSGFQNNQEEYLFTSESVAPGHPDKVCDQISDAILDTYLEADPNAKVAAETLATTNRVVIAGEVRSRKEISFDIIDSVARSVVKKIGYEDDNFHWKELDIQIFLHEQSPDIAIGVDGGKGKEEGAGDQGIMFGYACTETSVLMPATIYYAHEILKSIFRARTERHIEGLGPDAKSQITLLYRKGLPVQATSIVVSIQHQPHISVKEVREIIRPYVITALPEGWMCPEENFFVNPTGNFVRGGPHGDVGLTGRKIIVDTYGGAAPHGGGCFSGKDPSKVDRSAAYAARYLAKNAVAAGLADKCVIQLSYAIGIARPLSFYINTFGTAKVDEAKLARVLANIIDLSPHGIRKKLALNNPIYYKTAVFGHFGRTPTEQGHFTWEKTDLVEILRKECL